MAILDNLRGCLVCALGLVVEELELARLGACLLELGDLAVLALNLVVIVRDCVDVVGFRALSILALSFGIDRRSPVGERAFAFMIFRRILVSHTVLVN